MKYLHLTKALPKFLKVCVNLPLLEEKYLFVFFYLLWHLVQYQGFYI